MNKDIAVKDQGALVTNCSPRRGFEEGVVKEDLIIPRAKLLQALSPEVVDKALSPDGVRLDSGMIINSLTKDVLPSEFIPVFKFTNWVRFNPRNDKTPGYDSAVEPGAIIWRSSDPSDSKVQTEGTFGPNGEIPLATKFINFFAYFPGVPMPMIVSFSKTSYKAGKQLLSLSKFTPGDMFSRKYKLTSKQMKNDMGTFFVLAVDPAGTPKPEDYQFAEKLWDEFSSKAKDIQVHDEAATGSDEEAPF